MYGTYRADIGLTMLQLHKAGVLQGNFKDANIRISEDGEVWIVDLDPDISA